MPTTNVINSTLLKVHIGGTAVAKATDASLSMSHSPRDITTKDSSGWSESLEGLRSATISTSALMAYDAAYTIDDLFSLLNARSSTTVLFSTEVTGDTYYTASAYITELTQNSAGSEGNATLTASFQITGAVTEGTVV